MLTHIISITIAFLIDGLIGDPPHWPHPVKWMGSGIAFLEKRLNGGNGRKAKGIVMVLTIVCIVFLISFTLVSISYHTHLYLGIAVESILIATTISRRSLKEAALDVYYPLHKGELQKARLKLSYIVGRDTERLEEREIVRGTVETVAENTSDGVTAPLFWALIGGAPLALVYRAVNTCDSMVGYKNERFLDFGWASARLDDLLNWIPSRLTGFLLLLSSKPMYTNRGAAWKILFRDARRHPSPNSGWMEAAVAAILGIQLGGVNVYKGIISKRAEMGDPIVPLQKEHILLTNRLLTKASVLFVLALWMGGILFELASTWFESSIHI
ncbi:adenosylcobinamide-phosphate synthase CbiB [Robertmurraya andreesenii]|uniref:Cobalamin biosynthesis protein CobD n=1 Tax=Anoxybacillus andreesenii TaxID=1325932 RepID=A0ABT9V402_9BACL|nr:adenosylcobinamide-phosphate synthase CbiB [Robertmurraya andreesenii]MDQ0155678.1 adenosylcobinamide-phosphate synthase [Robertmurraya andreesenii]